VTLRSPLVPLVVLLLSFGLLVVNGWNATATLAENLPNSRASTNLRVVDLVHQTPNTGRIFDLIFERLATGPTVLRDDAHLKVQLSSPRPPPVR
jgi:predicted PurR-regulated permease PerM